MKFPIILLVLVLSSSLVSPAQADISGFVKNADNTGVAGVVVKVIADTTQKATTAGDGSFSMVIPQLSTKRPLLPSESLGAFEIGLAHGTVRIHCPVRAQISLGLYDGNGRQVSTQPKLQVHEGVTETPLKMPAATGFYLLKAHGQGFFSVLKIVCLEKNIFASALLAQDGRNSTASGKILAAPSIVLAAVPATGYFTATTSAPNGTANLVITLGTIPVGTVTYTGNVFNSNSTGETTQKVYFTALSSASAIAGTATATAEFNDIIANYCPIGAMNGVQARALQNQFIYRMQFDVAGSQVPPLFTATQWTGRAAYTLTGAVTQTAGRKVFTVASFTNGSFSFPAKLTASWVGLPASATPPLVLAVGTQTLRCIHVDPGKFLLGQPYYMIPSWQEDPPHLVTLTKGYYIAEIPVTNGLLQAATGTNLGGAANAAADISTANVTAFINAIKVSNPGKIIRAPTSAELMIAFRAGASNPPLMEKNLAANVTQFLVSAKSAPANDWGIYSWLIDIAWERSGDDPYSEHNDVTNPIHTAPACDFGGFGLADYNLGEFEYLHTCNAGPQTSGGHVQERIVVEE
jgi:hypothetical protein